MAEKTLMVLLVLTVIANAVCVVRWVVDELSDWRKRR